MGHATQVANSKTKSQVGSLSQKMQHIAGLSTHQPSLATHAALSHVAAAGNDAFYNPTEGRSIPAIMSTMVFQLQWFKSAEKAMVIGTRNAEYVPSSTVMTIPCHAEICAQSRIKKG